MGHQCSGYALYNRLGAGPHPYPMIVRDFQAIIGKEARKQILKLEGASAGLPNCLCGRGKQCYGPVSLFFNDKGVRFIGVEAGGLGLNTSHYAATLEKGRWGLARPKEYGPAG